MNNFCTRCGTKLNENDLVCPNCNLDIVDVSKKDRNTNTKQTNNKNSNKIIIVLIILLIILLIIIGVSIIFYFKSYIKNNIEEQLSGQNYKNIEFTSIKQCKKCSVSLDGSCSNYDSIPNCYIYYIKINFENSDVIETSLRYSPFQKDLPDNDISNYLYVRNIISECLDDSYYNIVYSSGYRVYPMSHVKIKGGIRNSLTLNFIEKIVNLTKNIYQQNNDITVSLDFEDDYTIKIYSKGYAVLDIKGIGTSIDTLNKGDIKSNILILKELDEELKYVELRRKRENL